MTLALLHPTLRAALRERLLTASDVSHAPGVSVALASGIFTRASGSWLDAGFAAGAEVTVTGFSASPVVGIVQSVAALTLKTDIAGATTVGGGGLFEVKLPRDIAWEGIAFAPTAGRPHVVESFRPVGSLKRSVGRGGAIEHRTRASFLLTYPAQRGTLAIERMAGALMKHFEPGAVTLSRAGVQGSIQNVDRTPLMFDGGWVTCSVGVEILSWTLN